MTDIIVNQKVVVVLDKDSGEVLSSDAVESARIETIHEVLIGAPNDMTWEECKEAYGNENNQN